MEGQVSTQNELVTPPKRTQPNKMEPLIRDPFRDITFSIPQLAEIFGVSVTALYDLQKEGIIQGRTTKKTKSETTIFGWEVIGKLADRFPTRIPKIKDEWKVKVFANLKGGTGKSTLAAQFVMRASVMGLKCLLIDADPQGHASMALGLKEVDIESLPTLRDVIIEGKPLSEVIIPITPFLSLIPANLDLAILEVELVPKTNREQRIPKVISELRQKYDLIVVDTNPSASIVNLSAIVAADELCIISTTDPMAVSGIKKMFKVLRQIDEDFGGTPPTRIVANMYDVREVVCQETLGFLRQDYGEYMIKTVVRRNTDIKEAQKYAQATWQYKRRSAGGEDIIALTNDLLQEPTEN